MQRILLTFATVFALSSPLAAQDLEVGLKALHAKDFQAALVELRPLAEQGNAEAQNCLGFMYLYGKGVAQDYNVAVQWYTLAAEKDHISAIYSLANLYADDFEDATAMIWFRKAAYLGHGRSQNSFGYLLMYGEGVENDPVEAIYWYKEASRQGVLPAHYQLGRSYYDGNGVTQNYVLSYMWYQISAANGSRNAEAWLKDLRENITPAEIALAKEMAITCMESGYQTCE